MASRKKPHPGQLDLFADAGAILFANDCIAALLCRDAARAEACLESLAREDPGYRSLDALAILCGTLREWPFAMATQADIAAAVHRLECRLHPAADAVLGSRAPEFLGSFWQELARAAEPLPYDPDLPDAFSAALYLRCHDYAAAIRAAESVPNRDGTPDALHWLALARHGLEGLEACRPALLRLALLAPERLPDTVDQIGNPVLGRDWKAFQAACGWLEPDEATSAWFPAWYLVEHPGTPPLSDTAPLPGTPAAQALAAIERLNALAAEGHSAELVSARSRLRTLAPELFALYMERYAATGHHRR